MSIKSTVRKWLLEERAETKADLGQIITPAYKDVPPPPKSGKFLTEGLQSWAFIAISAIADEIISTNLNLFKKNGKEWDEVEEHQVLSLMDKPNSFQTREEFMWLLTVYLLAEGEAPVVLDKAKNPTSMVLVNPEHLEVVTSEKDLVSAYKLTLSNGQRKEIKAEEVVFFKLPSVATPFRGTGVLKYISASLDLDNFTEEYMRQFFFNSARPDIAITTDQSLTQAVVDRFKSQWQKMYKGVKNSHRMAVLTNGMKIQDIGSKLNELQMNETDNRIRDKVLAAFKVPKSVLGIIEDVNRANGENADRVFARRAVKPKLLMIQAQMNQFLLQKFSDGHNLWFEFDNPVQEDELLKAQIRQANITAGIRTAAEYREEDGLDPIEEKQTDPMPEEDNQKDNQEKNKLSPLATVLKNMISKSHDRMFADEEKEKFHSEKIVMSDDIEARYKDRLNLNFKRQKNEILKSLEGKRKKQQIFFSFDTEKEAEAMAEISIPFIEETIGRQASLAAALLAEEPLISVFDDAVKAFVSRSTLKLGYEATETTEKDIKRIIEDWANAQAGISELKKSIREYFDDSKRAENIARTEVSRAAGFATEQTYKEAGVIGKQWITAPDERVCQFCHEMDGKIIGIGKNFWNKGDSMIGEDGGRLSFDYTGVSSFPLHPQCRCDIVPVFNPELVKEVPEYQVKHGAMSRLLDQEDSLRKKEVEVEETKKQLEKALEEVNS
jgi:HK97 family phage portal protein